jgi:YggT family protein
VIIASARTEIAGLLAAIVYVYIILIICHIVVQMLFSARLRVPYTRTSNAVIQFLRDVCEPFLRIFRNLLPSFGGLDFSPMVAIFALSIVNRIVVEGIIHG